MRAASKLDSLIWRRATITILSSLAAFLALSSGASAEVVVSRYVVSLAGVRVGDAILHTTLSAKRYKVTVSADVGVLLHNTKIQGEALGSRAGAKLTPEHFRMDASGSEEGSVDTHFAGAAAKGAKVPPQLQGVFDPLSALLVASLRPVSPPAHPCHSVLPILMGRARFNLRLQPKPATEAPATMVICQAHDTGRQAPAMEIAFMRLLKPQFWLVEHLSFETPNGTMTIGRVETAVSQS
ncbi:MAG: DUF3108 domain-containing protein [Rhodomicrobium sp.]